MARSAGRARREGQGLSQASPHAQPLVFIVVLNYRNYADTIRCVESLEALHYDNYRIVIMDNGSGNESEAELRRAFPQHRVVQTGANLGYAGGNNVGIRQALEADARYVMLLNNDTVADPDFLAALVDYAERNAAAGLLTPRIVGADGRLDPFCTRRRPSLMEIFWNDGIGHWIAPVTSWRVRHFYQGELEGSQPAEVEVISGASMFLRREMIDEVGLLDEGTFLFYEEFILHEKLRDTKFQTWIVPAARITHFNQGSMKQAHVAPIFANLKSLDFYLQKYRGVAAPLRWLIVSSAFGYFVPGLVKTLTGARALQARLRKAD